MEESSIIRVDFSAIPECIQGRELVVPNIKRLVPEEYDIRKLVVLEQFKGVRPCDVFEGLDQAKLLQYTLDAYDLEAIRKRGADFYKAHFDAKVELLAPRSAWRGKRMLGFEMTFPALLSDGLNILACPESLPLGEKYLVLAYQE